MDEQTKRRIEEGLAMGLSKDRIIQGLLSNPSFNGDLYEISQFFESKKKDSAPQEQTQEQPIGSELVQEDLDYSTEEDEPIAEPPVEGPAKSKEFNPNLFRTPLESNMAGYTPDQRMKAQEDETRRVYGGLQDYRKYFTHKDFGGSFSSEGADNVSAGAERLVEAMVPEIASSMSSSEELKSRLDSIKEEYKVGGTIVVPTYVRLDHKRIQTINRDVEVTQEMLDKKLEEAKMRHLEKEYYSRLNDLKPQVLEMIPEEHRGDDQFLQYLTDKVYEEKGIDLDLDENGRLKEQALVPYVAGKFATGASSLVQGFVDAVDYTFTGDDIKLAEKRKEQRVLAMESTMEFSKGMSASFSSGDHVNGLLQMGGSLAETLPMMAVVAGSGGLSGPLAVGTSGFGNGYTEALNDPDYGDNNLGRVAYAIANGTGDFLFSYVGNSLMKSASVAAQATTVEAKRSALVSGKRFTMDVMKAYGRRKGIAFGSEGLEEAATEVMTSVVEAIAKGEDLDIKEVLERSLDSFLIGGVAGTGFDAIGSMQGKSIAMAKAKANATLERAAKLEAEAEKVAREAETAESETEKRKLLSIAEGLRGDADRSREARRGFYTMLQTRHPEAAQRLMELDIEIEGLYRKMGDESMPKGAKKALKTALESRVSDRVSLERSFENEDFSLSEDERHSVFLNSSESYRARLDSDLELAEMAALEHSEAEGTPSHDSDAQSIAEKSLTEAKEKKDAFESLVDNYNEWRDLFFSARDSYVSDPEGAYDQKDILDARESFLAASEVLSEETGMSTETLGGEGTIGDFLDVQDEITIRYSGQWLVDAVENLGNSTLSKEGVEAILATDNWAMLTGENPSARAVGELSNKVFNNRAEEWLRKRGMKFHIIVGRYEAGENSFFVEGMTRAQAAEFASDMGQETVAHKDGLVLSDGSVNRFEGGPVYGSEVDVESNYLSVIRDENGDIISFSFSPGSTYEDADGNTIDDSEYKNRAKRSVISEADILHRLEEERGAAMKDEPSKPTPKVAKGVISASAVKTPRTKDGSPNWRAGMDGVENASQAKALNRFSKIAKAIGVEIYVHPNSESAGEFKDGAWGGIYDVRKLTDGSTQRSIHINPNQVRLNQLLEGKGGVSRTKSFNETLSEEVLHAMVGPAINKMFKSSPQAIKKIKSDLMNAFAKSDPEFYQRLALKESTYEQEGKSEEVVLEEVIMEFLSAIAADPNSVSLKAVDKARIIFNAILHKAFGGDGKSFSLKDAQSIYRSAKSFQVAKDDSNFRISVSDVTEEEKEDTDRESLRLVPPNKIKPDADGKVRVTVSQSVYSWRHGSRKDIGSEEVVKEFSDQWHFINWWKKATNMGQDDHYVGFKDNSGQEIDVDRIKNYKSSSRESSKLNLSTVEGQNSETRKMINAAVSQGIIPGSVAGRMKGKMNAIPEEELGMASEYYSTLEGIINKEAIALGEELNFHGGVEERSSQKLNFHLLSSISPRSERLPFGELAKEVGKLTGREFSPSDSQADVADVLRRWLMSLGGNPAGNMAMVMGEYVNSPDLRSETFGSNNPLNFFSNYSEKISEAVDLMVLNEDLTGSKRQNKILLNFITAMTSAQNKSDSNISVAVDIIKESNKNKTRRSPNEVVPNSLIRKIKSGGIDGVPVHVRRSASAMLSKLNSLIAGDLDSIPADVKVAMKEAMGDSKSFVSKSGDVKWDNIVEFLLSPYEGMGGKAEGLTMSQKIFGPKSGAWILNLNSEIMPDLEVSGKKLSDIVTIDTHVLNTGSMFLGEHFDAWDSAWSGLAPAVEYLYGSGSFEYNRIANEIYKLSSTEDGVNLKLAAEPISKILSSLEEKISHYESLPGDHSQDHIKRIEKIIDGVVNPKASKSIVSKRKVKDLVLEAAEMLDITPAQLGQLMFADKQAVKDNVFNSNPNDYSPYASSLQEFIQPQVEASLESETRSSQMLLMPESMKIPAKDSPLYRSRIREEALTMRNGKKMTKALVDDALSTDATSRRIIEKEIDIKDGQKIGVRLNLNVMKNTGIPVQTMHDKSAAGEALRYAPAVMVKNPKLFVNQNARRKILTFQENKFPMASVDGEFLTDRLDQMNFDGVKAFFNPFKHNVFVDASGRPIKSADEATIVGSTVYLRGNIEYYELSSPVLDRGRSETEEERAKRVKRGPKYDKAISRFEAFSKRNGGVFEDRAELEEAYDKMPIESKVALNESEIAANMEEAQVRASSLLKVRQTAARAARRFEDSRSKILNNPNNYFAPQNLKDLKGSISEKSNADLLSIMTDEGVRVLADENDNLGILAAGEMINRAVANGEFDLIPKIIERAAAMGTTAGRVLRHLRELKSSTPLGFQSLIKSEAEKRGNRLTEEQEVKLKDISERLFQVKAQHEDLMFRAIRGEDVEQDLRGKTKEFKTVERELDTFANAVIERGWGQLLIMAVQGNLLTPGSQVVNVGANVLNAITKIPVDLISIPAEKLANLFGIESSMKRNYSIASYMYGIRGFGSGFVEALDSIWKGQEKDVAEWRVHRGFAPFRSITAAMSKDDLPLGPDGKASLSQRMKLIFQGTLGIAPEIMFRFLSLGDVPFRRYVEGMELYHAGKNQGLEGEALKNFIKYPTKRSREAAEKEGRKLTFQEETKASKAAESLVSALERAGSGALRFLPDFLDSEAIVKVLVRSTIPYVRTPANILYDTLTFATPYVSIPRIMNNLKNGDPRAASENLGKAVVGGMVSQTVVLMIKEGLISGAIEWDEDEEKNIAYDQFPPSSINVTGLRRWIDGGDPRHRPDDDFISYQRLGVLGAVMGGVVKGVDKEELKTRDYSDMGFVTHAIQDAFGISAFSSMAHMMDQSFFWKIRGYRQVASNNLQGRFFCSSA